MECTECGKSYPKDYYKNNKRPICRRCAEKIGVKSYSKKRVYSYKDRPFEHEFNNINNDACYC